MTNGFRLAIAEGDDPFDCGIYVAILKQCHVAE